VLFVVLVYLFSEGLHLLLLPHLLPLLLFLLLLDLELEDDVAEVAAALHCGEWLSRFSMSSLF